MRLRDRIVAILDQFGKALVVGTLRKHLETSRRNAAPYSRDARRQTGCCNHGFELARERDAKDQSRITVKAIE